jgi:hypothetical protein
MRPQEIVLKNLFYKRGCQETILSPIWPKLKKRWRTRHAVALALLHETRANRLVLPLKAVVKLLPQQPGPSPADVLIQRYADMLELAAGLLAVEPRAVLLSGYAAIPRSS